MAIRVIHSEALRLASSSELEVGSQKGNRAEEESVNRFDTGQRLLSKEGSRQLDAIVPAEPSPPRDVEGDVLVC